MHQTLETELSHKTAFRNFVPWNKDVNWLHHRWYVYEHNVYSVTSEPVHIFMARNRVFKSNNECK